MSNDCTSERATTINEGTRESVRQLTTQFAGWLIAYHAGRNEFSATRPGWSSSSTPLPP